MGRSTGWVIAMGVLVACAGDEREGDPAYDGGVSGLTSPTSGGTGIDLDDDGGTSPILDVGGASASAEDGGDQPGCPCQHVMDGIYVLNTNNPPSVWFFDPPANTFTQVGTLGCTVSSGYTANSMAIDRSGHAWINYYDSLAQAGKMFKAPLWDLSSCEELPYQHPAGAWWLLGMGYAVVDAASSCDQLFVYKSDRYLEYPNFGPGGSHLGRYDEGLHQVQVIGPADYPVAELTGTGDGRLFAFAALGSGQTVLVNLDKTTGEELEYVDVGIDVTNAFAFAFWGGDVYFFTETMPLSGVSKVTRLDYDGNEGGGITTYNPNSGIHIAGAGVSTCASFTPPG